MSGICISINLHLCSPEDPLIFFIALNSNLKCPNFPLLTPTPTYFTEVLDESIVELTDKYDIAEIETII